MRDVCCAKCVYFEQHPQPQLEGMGWCHRSAPQATIFSDLLATPLAVWPSVDKYESWCGEFSLSDSASD